MNALSSADPASNPKTSGVGATHGNRGADRAAHRKKNCERGDRDSPTCDLGDGPPQRPTDPAKTPSKDVTQRSKDHPRDQYARDRGGSCERMSVDEGNQEPNRADQNDRGC